jgi:hypothetical protein
MPWVKAGPVDWTSLDSPGYVIVRVGEGYEVYQGTRRISQRADDWDVAVGPIEADMNG